MKVETRDRMYVGVRVKVEDLFQLADTAADLFDEPVTVELTVRKESYEIVVSSLPDLLSTLNPEVDLAGSVHFAVHSSRGSLIIDISPRGGVGVTWLILPYLRAWTSYLKVRHEDPRTADALLDEASKLLRKKLSVRNEGFSVTFLYAQACVVCVVAMVGRDLFLHPTWDGVGPLVGFLLFVLIVEQRILGPRVRLRPRTSRWSWEPSEASAARWTVIAGVLAIPALLLGVVSLFVG